MNIHLIALRFRLLREHRHNVKCDVFKKFMGNRGNFNKYSCEDVEGLLSLYEASYVRVEGEAILDEALQFTTNSLQSLLPCLDPFVAKQVRDTLYRPLRKRMARVEARNYLSVYEQIEDHNEVLLQFAKLDFNILQQLHLEELTIMSKWWYEDLDYERKFPFVRDRIVEAYYWALGVYAEPQFTISRRFLTQILAMISIVDDIYDAYGTVDELELFTEAIAEKWDCTSIVDLPEDMKACCQQLFDVFRKTEEEIVKQEKSLYALECAKEEFKRLSRAYMEERKWVDKQERPTIEEYMKVGFDSSACTLLTIASLVSMDDVAANEQAINWLLSRPKSLKATSIVCRLMNDIVSYKFERERGESVTAIESYTWQYNVSDEEACDVFRKEVEEAWKDVNEAFVSSAAASVATSALMSVLNLTRAVEVFYRESDYYTHVTPALEELITSSLFSTVQL